MDSTRIRARVTCTYGEDAVSKAIVAAIGPDNLQAPEGISMGTVVRGKRAVTELEMDGRIETLLATLDDLLSCTLVAESVL